MKSDGNTIFVSSTSSTLGSTDEFQICVSSNDVHIFDGNTFRSILDERMRRFFNTELFAARMQMAFVAVSTQEKEAWICFPAQDETGTMFSTPCE